MTEPISLLDLRRKHKLHQLNGGEHAIEIKGVTAREVTDLLERFGILRIISMGGEMSPTEMIANSPGAAAAWVATVCGRHGDPEAEKAAEENLTIEETSEIIEESLKLTFSKGFGPFSGRLVALLSYVTVTAGRGRDMNSGPPSPPAAPPSTTGSGNSPPDSSKPISSSPSDADSPIPPT